MPSDKQDHYFGIHSTIINVSILLANVVLCLVAMEVYFALTYKSPFPDDALLIRHDITEYTPPINAEGFRQEAVPASAMESDTTRILFLGDSFTFGLNVEDGSLRFTSLIESKLNAESTSHYHVYNAGIPGSNPHNWIPALVKLLPLYKPNIVFAVFFLRDGTGMGLSLNAHRQQIASLRQEYADTFLYRHSFLARTIIDHQMVEAFNVRYHRDLIRKSYLGTEEEQKVWRAEQQSLKELQTLCAQAGIPFHLIIFPALFQLHDYPYKAVEEAIGTFASSNNIPFMSLTGGFLGRDEQTLWVGPGDQHPNPLGHRIAAETLYHYLKTSVDALTSK